jgi:hypothetical protein
MSSSHLLSTLSKRMMMLAAISSACYQLVAGQDLSVNQEYVSADLASLFQWRDRAPMPVARSDLAAVTVGNMIVVIGGCLPGNGWDPVAGAYQCGGPDSYVNSISNRTDLYYPDSNTWVRGPDMPTPRYRFCATYANNKIYAIGGRYASGNWELSDVVINSVDVLDVATLTWEPANTYQWPGASSNCGCFTLNNTAYVVGGWTQNYSVTPLMFYLNGTQFVQDPRSLNVARGDLAVHVDGANAYVLGGFIWVGGESCCPIALNSVEMLSTTGWTLIDETMPIAAGDPAFGVLDRNVYVFAGETAPFNSSESVPIKTIQYMDVVDDSWSNVGVISSERFRLSAAGYGNSIYLFGGQKYLTGSYEQDGSIYSTTSEVEEFTFAPDLSAMLTQSTGMLQAQASQANNIAIAAIVFGVLSFVIAIIALSMAVYLLFYLKQVRSQLAMKKKVSGSITERESDLPISSV